MGACPVSLNETVDPWDEARTRDVIGKGLRQAGIRVIIARSPCPYIEEGFCPGYSAAGAETAVFASNP